MSTKARKIWIVLALFVGFPSIASANAGLPMLLLVWPGFLVLLVPIVLLEAAYGRRFFPLGWKDSLGVSALANVVSTIAGIPLTWVVLLLLEMAVGIPLGFVVSQPGPIGSAVYFIVSSPWLLPDETHIYWQLPLASAILCVPFFFASVFIESRVARRILPDGFKDQSTRWAWRANLLSYSPIVATLLACAWLFAFVIR